MKDIAGQRYGRLVVIERAGRNKQKRATWKCQCDCGKISVVASSYLLNGNTRSCGCLRLEGLVSRNVTHKKAGIRLHIIWKGMKQRCTNPLNPKYQRYGRRGITVCDEWIDDFEAFYEWAMANGYDENAPYGQCTIDRIDNDKGYSPDNCRWVDIKTQNNNRSRSGPLPKRKKE